MNVANINTYYFDSGASSHMTPHRKLLTDMKPCDVSEIYSANDAKLKVNGAGNGILRICENNIPVSKILLVPGLSANLFSVRRNKKIASCALRENKQRCHSIPVIPA